MTNPTEFFYDSNISDDFCQSVCGDGGVDVKGKIGIAVKRLEIKAFKDKGRILVCGF